jgi:hypothetical protein
VRRTFARTQYKNKQQGDAAQKKQVAFTKNQSFVSHFQYECKKNTLPIKQ